MKKSQNTSWNTITKLNEHTAEPLTLAFMETRYAQDMVSRLFFVSFYTHGKYQTFQKEGDFWSILSSMYNFTVIDNLIWDVLTWVILRNKKYCLLFIILRIFCFSSLKLLKSTRLCFRKQKATEERERNMKQFICEVQIL